MRHLLACLAITAAFNAAAQSTMPYNPDADDDSYIGASDILGLLPLYGQQFGIDSSLTCDYDGSTLDQWLGDLFSGIIVLDSVLMQFHVEDSSLVFIAGCPDPVMDYVSYERSFTLTNNYGGFFLNTNYLGYDRKMWFDFFATDGTYRFQYQDREVQHSGIGDVLGSHNSYALSESGNAYQTIPIAGVLSEAGIEMNWSGFLDGATYVNLLPYWHYAE